MFGAIGDFADVPGVGAGEDLGELGNQRARHRATGNNGREDPPKVGIHFRLSGEQEIAGHKGHGDGNRRSNPDEMGQRGFKIEVLLASVFRLADGFVQEVGNERRYDHQRAHREQPDDERGANGLIVRQGQGQKRDQGHARHAVSLEAVRRGADAVARVVARAIGNHAGVLRVVFGQLEDDFHEVGADIGDFRENAAANAEDARAEGFADGEPEHQDADHEKQFDRDEQQADAHAGAERDAESGERVALQGGERRAGVGDGIDADTEPGHSIRAQYAENRGEEDDDDVADGITLKNFEIVYHAGRDQDPKDREKFALREEVGFAGLPDDMGDVGHAFMHGEGLGLFVLHQAERRPNGADENSEVHQSRAANATQAGEVHLRQIRDMNISFAGESPGRAAENGQQRQRQEPKFIFCHSIQFETGETIAR